MNEESEKQMKIICKHIEKEYTDRYESLEREPEMKEKQLDISEVKGAKENISDLKINGDGDTFRLLCKASSQEEGWMKSTKVCNTPYGCIVQVTTQQRNADGTYSLAEALTYVPHVNIDINANPRRLEAINKCSFYSSKKLINDFKNYNIAGAVENGDVIK